MSATEARGAPAMSDVHLVSEIVTLIVAGHETTAITLGWAWRLIAERPDVEARLRCEGPDFASRVIEETLRLYPPGWLMTRRAIGADRLGEHEIAPGTEVYISPYFIQRSPSLWSEPEAFDPDRFAPERAAGRAPLATMPFSAGPRNCVGEAFARLQMRIHLTSVASRLRLGLAGAAAPRLVGGVNLRPASDIVMTPSLVAGGPARAAA